MNPNKKYNRVLLLAIVAILLTMAFGCASKKVSKQKTDSVITIELNSKDTSIVKKEEKQTQVIQEQQKDTSFSIETEYFYNVDTNGNLKLQSKKVKESKYNGSSDKSLKAEINSTNKVNSIKSNNSNEKTKTSINNKNTEKLIDKSIN